MGAVSDDAGIQVKVVRQASRRRCPELSFQPIMLVLWLPKQRREESLCPGMGLPTM